jgi:hypothetical protein
MSPLAMSHSVVTVTLWTVAGLIALSILAGLLSRFLIRSGLRQPIVVRMINRASDRVVEVVKRPITVAVLDEVADVLKAGTYTQNAAAAIRENHEQLTAMIAEKIKNDPTAGRIGLLPFHDRLLHDLTETALRVLLAVLADPRTDELFADLLRDNIDQLRIAVRRMDL